MVVSTKMLRVKDEQNRHDCEGDHDQEIGDRCWAKQFPEDLMRPILQRLCKSDYLSCRVVCLSWRAAVDKAIASKNCPPAPRLPWLIRLDSRHRFRAKDHRFVNKKFYEPMRVSEKLTSFVSFSRRRLVGAIEGWLIMVDNLRAVYFLNPITGARVMLPSRSTINHTPFTFKKVVASSVPTRLQHCLVASVSKTFRLAFCKPTDKSWTIIEVEGEEDELQFVSIEIIDEKLYAVSEDLASYSITVFHISYANDGPPSYTAERLFMQPPTPFRFNMGEILPRRDEALEFVTYMGDRSPYLTKDSASKELYMIFHRIRLTIKPVPEGSFIGRETTKSIETERFRVFKLECDVNGARWVEVVDLGDRILFLSSQGSNFVSSSNGLSCSGDKLERNCIYYAFGFPSTDYYLRRRYLMHGSTNISIFGVYSLTNRNVKQPHPLVEHHATSFKYAWFTPNPNPNPW